MKSLVCEADCLHSMVNLFSKLLCASEAICCHFLKPFLIHMGKKHLFVSEMISFTYSACWALKNTYVNVAVL